MSGGADKPWAIGVRLGAGLSRGGFIFPGTIVGKLDSRSVDYAETLKFWGGGTEIVHVSRCEMAKHGFF